MAKTSTSSVSAYAFLPLRLGVGVVLLLHGWDKASNAADFVSRAVDAGVPYGNIVAYVAIAVGFVMVNMAKTFVSPTAKQPTLHRQPDVTEKVIEKMKELPRRSSIREDGFDALAIVVVECANDGKPVRLVKGPPAPPVGDIFNYEMMIQRLAGLYEARQR